MAKLPMPGEAELCPVRAANSDGVLVAVADVTVLVSGDEKKPGPNGGGLTLKDKNSRFNILTTRHYDKKS